MRLWHLTTKGKSVSKAFIGDPLDRSGGESHLADAIARIELAMNDSRSVLKIETVDLCGSLLNPEQLEFGDVDILVRVARDAESPLHAASILERQIAAEDPHMDVMVYDGLNWPYPIAVGSATQQLLPRARMINDRSKASALSVRPKATIWQTSDGVQRCDQRRWATGKVSDDS